MLEPLLHTIRKTQFQLDYWFKLKWPTLMFLGYSIEEYLHDFSIGKRFLSGTQKA